MNVVKLVAWVLVAYGAFAFLVVALVKRVCRSSRTARLELVRAGRSPDGLRVASHANIMTMLGLLTLVLLALGVGQ